jgi:hypothetical protein
MRAPEALEYEDGKSKYQGRIDFVKEKHAIEL